jgi:pyruvate ferredoxin oxidoreductase beta subunit/2-oxoisovalerate ferredoxin oxidoreductase beta subunit
MRLVFQAMGPRTIAVIVPSCEGSIGGVYPVTAYGVSTFHSAFEIAAPTAAGIANALKIQGKDDIQVVAFAGDGGTFDIGLQSLSGATKNNEDIVYVCLDNEAYMNTGIQVSSATPSFAWTGTTPKGIRAQEKHHGDNGSSLQSVLGDCEHRIPQDLRRKIVKAKSIRGTKFIHMLVPCPTDGRHRIFPRTCHSCG